MNAVTVIFIEKIPSLTKPGKNEFEAQTKIYKIGSLVPV